MVDADKDVLDQINRLSEEEHALWQRAGHGDLSREDHERLEKLQVTLDQCWDLLHQRRALRNAGEDPSRARVRDAETVENYVN